MAKKLYEESDVRSIANAIRAKNGLSDTYKVGEMANAVSEIETAEVNTDLSLGITSAIPGQIAKIAEVDSDGKPIAWEPVDNMTATLDEDGNVIIMFNEGMFVI